MTSQGQRFRRRALRRGYKVDEVDSFLDRVEATLAGEPVSGPVTAQEVHDVVFRVRFGGYDEWQVDLHLDRVERQLAEFEERGGPARGPEPRMVPDRMGPPMERMAPPPDRMGPMMRDDRQMPPMAPPMPQRPMAPMPAPAGPPPDPYGSRYDEPTTYATGGFDTLNRYESPERFDGFEPGRHGKTDMTAEIRMPDRDRRGPAFGGPPPMSAPAVGAAPIGTSPVGGPAMAGPPLGGPPVGAPGGDAQRIDQLRRTFQPRRFGSGYDPAQVDGLFDGILAAMTGRGPMPVNESELDTLQFGLVPGGYFEAEVDAALREVKDILRRR